MSSAPLNQQLVLPNTLVNARYPLSVQTMRFWQVLLAHLPPQGSEFQEICIPIGEVLAPSGRKLSDKDYAVLAVMNGQLSTSFLEFAGPESVAPPLVASVPLPLLEYVRYEKHRGLLRVRLAQQLRPYLTQPVTIAPRRQVCKLRHPAAFRLYWLLREYAACGVRILALPTLAWLLGQPLPCRNPSLLCTRFLAATRPQLAQTDLPFEAELLRVKQRIYGLQFTFPSLAVGQSSMLLPGRDEPGPSIINNFDRPESAGDCLLTELGMLLLWVALFGAFLFALAGQSFGVG